MTGDKTSQIHVCLVSSQPIANLLPLLLEKPVKVFFLVSPEMTVQAERLRKIVQPRGIGVEVLDVFSAYDFDAMARLCAELLESGPEDAELVLNVTGGTKIGALAAFQAFFFENKRIIYLDSYNNELLQLSPETTALPIRQNLIKVRDCLTAYGMNPFPVVPAAEMKRRGGLAELAALLIHNEDLLSRLNGALGRQGDKKRYLNCTFNELGELAEELAELLETCGVARRTGTSGLNIPSAEKIFFCKGGWLEEYAYWAVRDLGLKGLDAAMNVKVEWDGKGRRPTENEFDVLFTFQNRLHLISCKASNPERVTASGSRATEALNELDTLADRAGGLFGRAMLLSARRLSDYDRSRAARMKIRLVDGPEVLRLPDHLRDWLQGG